MIFTIGNLITLGIVTIALISYRLADKNNRSLERVKKYAEKCKEEIAVYAEEKSMAVKNFGIDLDVEKKSAQQLMKNIQKLTEEELTKKSETISRIEGHIQAFESSLEELFGMTDRVQENLNRIRDESAFVESTGKRVNDAKDKFEQVEKALNAARKNLEDTEERLERKNAETLEQTARDVVTQAKSIVSDFEAASHVIERKVEEHREAIVKAEREREAVLTRDLELIKKTLTNVFENAGKRADKLEDAALVKLREQAQERVNQIKVFFEEKIKTVQETLKTEQSAVNEKVKGIHDKWNAEILDISTKQKNYHQEFTKSSAELDNMAKKQKEEIITSLSRQQEEITGTLARERETINTALVQQQNDWKQNFIEFKKLADKQHKELDISINTTKFELNQTITELKTKSLSTIKQQQEELDSASKQHQKDIISAISDLKEKSNSAVKQQQQEITTAINKQQQETSLMVSKLNTSITELHEKSKTMYKQHQDEFSSILGDLKEKSSTAINQQQDELSLILGDIKNKSEAAVKQHQQEITTVINQQQQETSLMVSKLNTSIAELQEQSKTLYKQQQDELSSSLRELKEKSNLAITSQNDGIENALRELKEKSNLAITSQHEELTNALGELKEKTSSAVKNQNEELNTALKTQMDSWKLLCKDTEQNIITANEKRLEDYSNLHTEAVKQLNNLADDASRLENELRLSMQDAIARVKNDFSLFEKESGTNMETTAAAFNSQAQAFKKELEDMDKELDGIRQQAIDNVSENLTNFENDFTAELGKRASEMGRQIADWQAGLQQRLENSAGKITQDWQQAEERITGEQRKNIISLGDKLTSDLERLKQETTAFEMGIREEMTNVEETRQSFAEQIKHDLADIRITAENEVKTQVGEYQISMQETLRQKQRELEKEIQDISDHSKTSYASLDENAALARKTFDEWQSLYNTRMREMDNSFEDLRRHGRETAAENDERIVQFRQNLEDIRKELNVQKKTFDQAYDLKQDLERRIEEINTDLNRLDQRKNEITQLENQLTRVKRLEDEVNNKMTHFLSERHRIELMQKDFERLIKTSQSVEEKLVQVSTSDDILSNVQVQIRKLEDHIKETEEKYQRIERKNEVLEETTESIDRNFKSLQKTETAIKNAETIINTLSTQFENLTFSIETLAAENIKATEAVEKISTLDESLLQIEQRITEMNVAREWVANSESRLKELDKEVRTQLKLMGSLLDRSSKGVKQKEGDKGAPPPQHRDNAIRLKNQGWKNEEIANILGMSIGEVELILEIGSRS